MILKKKRQIWLLTIDSRIDTALLFATAKTTCMKYLQKKRKELCTEFFDEMKNNPIYSVISAKMLMAKFETFFEFYYISQVGNSSLFCQLI